MAGDPDKAKLPVVQHSAHYLATRLLGAALQLILLLLLTRTLTPDDYGRLALFTSTFSFALTLFFNPWRHTLTRFWPSSVTKQPLFLLHLTLGVLMSILAWSGGMVLVQLAGWFHGGYSTALVLTVIAAGWVEINLELHRRLLNPGAYARVFLVRSFTQLVFVALGVWLAGNVLGAIAGLMASHVLAALLSPWRLWFQTKITLHDDRSIVQEKLGRWLVYALPLALTEFVAMALIYTDRIMIAAQLGLGKTGIYSATHDLTWMGLHVVSLVAYLAFFPIAVEAHETRNKQAGKQALSEGFTLLFGLSLASTLGLILLAVPVTHLVLGEEFRTGAPRLMMFVAVNHLVFVLKIYWIDLGFILQKKTWPLLVIGLFTILSNVLFNLLFVPLYGVEGAAIATGVSSLLSILLSFITVKSLHLAHYPVFWPDTFKTITACLTMSLVLLLMPDAVSLVGLTGHVIIGMSVFITTLFLLRLSLLKEIFLWKKPM